MTAASENRVPKCAIWTRRTKVASGTPRVLVVDDYVDTADAISMVLAICGFDADAVYGGRVAIDATARCKPEVVLLDIWMPDMSGLEVAARLRADANTSGTILIAHSAAASEADLQRAKHAGFDAFCAKPTDATTFAPLLRHFVHGPAA
ncbi:MULTISPECIES: response regulator [unclassified Caballeronia]|uniref:response regulator n=1 Tax=unclassified Caballeronia TaxID=2646786 RepID=UPI001F3BD13D|nr:MULTISPECIES: response regulator [unclassified Caballeronia]MCE4547567.1 response regulator [Caballeronia sp. PC1]MCE4575026.1 response regulator [Caballeronia sp. CLC5]